MNNVVIATSSSADPDAAVIELAQQFSGHQLSHVLFFCSAQYPLERLAKSLDERLKEYQVTGCTTAGEITPSGYAQGSIVAIGFSAEMFSISSQLVERLDLFDPDAAQGLMEKLREGCTTSKVLPASDNSFAITLIDGLSIQEEIFLATLNLAMGSISNFGGSAGDDVNLARTYVFQDGQFYSNAAVVLFVTTPLAFKVFSTHHLVPTETKLVVTEAEVETREVTELNAEPAKSVYHQISGNELPVGSMQNFALHPLAVKWGNDYFVRSIQSIENDVGLKFFCAIENGIVLTLMKPTNLVDNITIKYNELVACMGAPQIIIGFDCILRRVEATEIGVEREVSRLLSEIGVVGLNTYGEQLQGMHLNQTFTGVAIGKDRR